MHAQSAIKDVYRKIATLAGREEACALALVLQVDGPVPAKWGSKAVFRADELVAGTIGGGWVEAATHRRVGDVLAAGRPLVLDFDLHGRSVTGDSPICGGAMQVLLTPLDDPMIATCREIAAAIAKRQRGLFLTTIGGGRRPSVDVQYIPESDISGLPRTARPDELLQVLQDETTRIIQADNETSDKAARMLVEPVLPQPRLLIVGGGHVGQALAAQSQLAGFEIVVVDDRAEFTRAELFPTGTWTICGDISTQLLQFPVDRDCYIVIVTRGHQHDAAALTACLSGPAAYVGMIGSHRKVAMLRQECVESGRWTAQEFDRVYAPIGLNIGAVTVPEIATSILAQLIQVRRQGRALRIPSA